MNYTTMDIFAFVLAMFIIGGGVYLITKVIENRLCSDNAFIGFLNVFSAFVVEAAVIMGMGYLVFALAAAIKMIFIAL